MYISSYMSKVILLSASIVLSLFTNVQAKVPEKDSIPLLQQQIESLQQETMQLKQNKMSNADTSDLQPKKPLYNLKPIQNSLHAQSFNEVMQRMLPLSSEQILQLHQQYNQTQAAIATHPQTPPKPVVASRFLSLEPGSTPMVVRLAQGYISTLAFLDATGQPWPISSYNIGDPQGFNVQWDKKSNVIMIQATKLYNTGNLAIQLQDQHVPIMLTLISGQKAIDYRLDMRVQGNGPYAKPLLGRNLPDQADPELLNVLDGIPPAHHIALKITGGSAQAWLVGNRLYLRTRLTILSPAWLSSVSSLEGMKAYVLPKTSFILGTNNGQTVELKVENL